MVVIDVIGGLVKAAWNMRYIIGTLVGLFVMWRTVTTAAAIATTAYHAVVATATAVQMAYGIVVKGSAAAQAAFAFATGKTKIAVVAFSAVMKVAQAVQWAFNAAMAANPIGLVVAAIVALIAIIVVMVIKWKEITSAVDGFFAKIRNMTGVGGAILKFLVTPFETAWRMIRSVFDIFAAFKAGGFLNGLKMIGLAILQWLVAPLQGMLQALSFLPGIGTLSEKMNNWFDTTRQNLLNGGGLPKTEEDEAAVAGAAPTASAAAANSYSREESVTTSRVEVGLADGLEVKNGSAAAPNFTLNTGGR